ncbi:MAG: recombinase family protein [Parabacteroides sp.]|nr:recombinase family protein [Parabacteroides sp.]
MTIAFIRAYNNKQNTDAQEAMIREFAECQKIEIGKWAKEVGKSPRANRRLEGIVSSSSPGDEILVSDISRVSYKVIEIIHILLLCIERKVTLRSVSDGYVFDDNIDSKTLAFTFALVSDIEKKLVSTRTKEALALSKTKGVVLGRPKRDQLEGRLEPHKEQIEKDLKDPSLTYDQIAEKYKVSLGSLKRFMKTHLSDKKKKK